MQSLKKCTLLLSSTVRPSEYVCLTYIYGPDIIHLTEIYKYGPDLYIIIFINMVLIYISGPYL